MSKEVTMNTLFIILSVITISTASDVWTGPFADNVIGQQVAETPEVAAARRSHEQFYAQVRANLPELPVEEEHQNNNNYIPQPVLHNPYLNQQHFPAPPFTTPAPYFGVDPVQPRWTGPIADHINGQVVHETKEVAAARKHHEDVFSQVRSILPELPVEQQNQQGQNPHYVPQNVHLPQQHHETGPDFDALSQEHLRILLQNYGVHQTTTVRNFGQAPVARFAPNPVAQWGNNGSPTETPEVAAARAGHARAIAALLNH